MSTRPNDRKLKSATNAAVPPASWFAALCAGFRAMIDKGDLMLVLTNDHPAHGGACACCGSFKPVPTCRYLASSPAGGHHTA
jgi:hypothetical protein